MEIKDVIIRALNGGVQTLVFFENGYGASVVKRLALMYHQSDYAEWLTDEYIGKPVIVDFGYENESCYLDSFDRILKNAGLKFKIVEDNEK